MENPGLHDFITNQSWCSSLQDLSTPLFAFFYIPKIWRKTGITEAGLPLDKQYLQTPEECIFSGHYIPGLKEVQDSLK